MKSILPKGKMSIKWVSSRNVLQVYIGGRYLHGCSGDTEDDCLRAMGMLYNTTGDERLTNYTTGYFR